MRDRVAQVYLGLAGNDETQQVTRRRINWVCQSVDGERILDVGCSEGIASLLLAREGHSVVGIDVLQEALDFAREAMAKEASQVQERVRYIHSDLLSLDLDGEKFDTVILGEVIEHLNDPRAALARAADFVAEGGRLIVTTPFGYFPDIDHRQTFPLTDFISLVRQFVAPLQLDIRDGYIVFVGRKQSDHAPTWEPFLSSAQIIPLLERTAIGFQTVFHERIRLRNAMTEEKVRLLNGNLNTRINELKSMTAKMAVIEGELRSVREECEALAQERRATNAQVTVAEEELRSVREQLQALAQEGRATTALLQETRTLLANEKKLAAALKRARDNALAEQQKADKAATEARRQLARIEGAGWWRLGVKLAKVTPTFLYRALAPKTPDGKKSSKPNAAPVAKPAAPAVKAQPQAAPAEAPKAATPAPAAPLPLRSSLPVQLSDLRLSIILDEFSTDSFSPDCRPVSFSPADWREVVEGAQPNMLLVESAWNGNGGNWHRRVGKYSDEEFAALKELVEWHRGRGIPTVFWNKEDPVHFNRFVATAELFDHVFTTDDGSVANYRKRNSPYNRSVAALPFAAQPLIHNPIRVAGGRTDSVCYAGTYYLNRYPDRCRQLDAMLDASVPHGLVIYDRHFGNPDSPYKFPERFLPYNKGFLPYEQLVREYRTHKVFLNVNSVTDSGTMCSRRVYELLACGTAVVSGPGRGVESVFGSLVPIVEDAEAAVAVIRKLMADEGYRRELTSQGARKIWREHTYAHRLATVCKAAGLDLPGPTPVPYSVLVLARSQAPLGDLAAQIAAQSHKPKQVCIGLDGAGADEMIAVLDQAGMAVQTVDVAGLPEAEAYARLAASAICDWVGIVAAGHRYGEFFFEDLAHCRLYAHADVFGKRAYATANGTVVNAEDENCFTSGLHPEAVLARRRLIRQRGWNPGAGDWQHDWALEGTSFFASDRDSFVAAGDRG